MKNNTDILEEIQTKKAEKKKKELEIKQVKKQYNDFF